LCRKAWVKAKFAGTRVRNGGKSSGKDGFVGGDEVSSKFGLVSVGFLLDER
jgi:hypothetical protein